MGRMMMVESALESPEAELSHKICSSTLHTVFPSKRALFIKNGPFLACFCSFFGAKMTTEALKTIKTV